MVAPWVTIWDIFVIESFKKTIGCLNKGKNKVEWCSGVYNTGSGNVYDNKSTKPRRGEMEIYYLRFSFFMWSSIISIEDRVWQI